MKIYRMSDRRFLVLITLVLCFIYVPYLLSNRSEGIQFIKGDCFYYRAVIGSLLNDGDLLLQNNIDGRDPLDGQQLALGRRGLVPKHPIIMPVVSIPFYYLFKDYGLLLFNVLDSMLLIMLIYKLNRLFFDKQLSFFTQCFMLPVLSSL